MTEPVAITQQELALILEALDDAAFYRDARSRVLQSAARRNRRSSPTPVTSAEPEVSLDAELHKRKAQAYGALALKLKQQAPAARRQS
jgi:hypothetical protein